MNVTDVGTDDLSMDPGHPRQIFAEGEIDALCDDLRMRGLIIPLIVFTHDGRNVIVDGARRWIAAKRAGLKRIKAIVLAERPSNVELSLIRMSLDFHRSPHNPMERSNLLAGIQRETGWSISEMASRLSMKQSLCTKLLKFQNSAPALQNLVATGALDIEKAYILSQLPDHESQLAMVKEYSHLSREAIRAKIKSRGKPVVKTSRATFALPSGESIAFKGQAATLEAVIERFTETLKRLRKGLNDGLDVVTIQRMFKDQARQSCRVK